MNKCILVGNLTRDPEISQTPSGVSVCKFCVAVNRNYTNASGERETDFINVVAWRNLAENCGKYLVKGKKAAVCGSMQTRSYEDKEGVTRYVTEVIADEVEFIGGNAENAAEPKQTAQTGLSQRKQTSLFADLAPLNDNGLPF